jgi:hypothetical protein
MDENKTDNEYPFEHGKVIHCIFDGVSIHPVTTNIQTAFLNQLPEGMKPIVSFKLFQSLMTVIGKN